MSKPKHIVSSSDLSKNDNNEIVRRFNHFIKKGISPELMRGKIVATLFFQPSTRTMNTFQIAMLRAGGGWIGVTDENDISMGKGETLEETIREYSAFADAIVLRHPDDDSADRAAANSEVPIINAGSGSREHGVAGVWMLVAMQYYLDRPSFENLKIGIYGTPEINRATKAMVPIFGMYGAELYVDDLGEFPIPKDVEAKAKANGLKSLNYAKLNEFIRDVDVLFVTRGLQKGIIPADKFPKEKEEAILKKYLPITKDDVAKMRKDAILYMIKPRIFEIEKDVDSDPRAVYAKKEPYAEVGLAILSFLMGVDV